MLKLAFCFLVLTTASLLAFAQSAQKKDESKPTLQETTDWLREKLSGQGGYISKDPKGDTITRKLDLVTFEGCRVSFRDIAKINIGLNAMGGTTVDYSFSLSDINPNGIKTETSERNSLVKLFTDKDVIRTQTKVRVMDIAQNSDAFGKEVFIPFSDKELAERVAKAFAHAITLCKKQKEPF